MVNKQITTLTGRTVHWTFDDGPTAGKAFAHAFNEDGSVDYWQLSAGGKGDATHEDHCAAVAVADGVFAVSYLGASGYTLTVVLDMASMTMTGFASNEKQWVRQEGAFTIEPEA